MSLLIAPIEALTDRRLSDPERRVLLALFSFRGKNTDTVWPSLPALGKIALVNDPARVSKLTTSLAQKGWLSKRKRGFAGGNTYVLTVPPEAVLEHEKALADDANLAPQTKLGGDTNTNLAPQTKSNLVPDTKCNEQTIEQTIEQIRANDLFATSPEPVEIINPDSWELWIEYLKARRMNPTEHTIRLHQKRLAQFDHDTQRLMIERSIENNYRAPFEVPKEQLRGNDRFGRPPTEDRSAAGRIAANARREREAIGTARRDDPAVGTDGPALRAQVVERIR